MKSILATSSWIHNLLMNPKKVLWLSIIFSLASLTLNGTFLRIYALSRDQGRLQDQIYQVQNEISAIDKQLRMAKDPTFIERQALESYDLVDEKDLVFVFADE